jgi:hypothetical protein
VEVKASEYVSVKNIIVLAAVHTVAACCRPERHKVKKNNWKKKSSGKKKYRTFYLS